MLQLAGITTGLSNEEERLQAVRYYSVSTAGQDTALDNLAQLVVMHFKVPFASISLIDRHEVLIKAGVGLNGVQKMDRERSLCTLSLLQDDPTFIENAHEDHRFSNHPLVTGEMGVCFYASAPIRTTEGYTIGAVCIGDREARTFSKQDCECLARFAQAVMQQIQLKSEIDKRAKKIAEKEYQLEQAFKMARIGTWEFDLAGQKAYWSDELYEVYGIEKSDLKGDELNTYLSLLHPDDLAATLKELENAATAPDTAMDRMLNKDGSIRYIHQVRKRLVDEQGNLVKIIGISQDVTERIEHEQKLKDSEERFKALVQNGSDLTAVLDEKGEVKYVSPTSHRISGYTSDELIGRNVFEFIHESDMDKLIMELTNVVNEVSSGEPTLHRFKSKEGRWIWLESKAMNMLNDRIIGGIIVNARDVTERKHLEETLADEQQKMQRAVTSAAIRAQEAERSQLGRELHDNINQVLTTVKLYTEMIDDGIGDQKELIRKAGGHLQNCIDEIRSISKRLSAPTLGEISLEDSINELVESINLTNRIEVVFSGNGITDLHISQEIHLAIYRIIQEQLNNILKHAAASLVYITLEQAGCHLNLCITDNGKGFDPGAKRTGIGLTNMRTRAENLGGNFLICSEKEKGCQLQVLFPIKPVLCEEKEG